VSSNNESKVLWLAASTPRVDGVRSSPQLAAQQRALLAGSEVFSNLADDDLDFLIERSEMLQLGRGATVFQSGDPGDHVLVILNGRVAVQTENLQGGPVVVNVLETGEIFGEMAVLGDTPRTATVTAIEGCELLAIHRAEFLPLILGHPGVGIRVLGMVMERLKRLTEVVAEQGAGSGSRSMANAS